MPSTRTTFGTVAAFLLVVMFIADCQSSGGLPTWIKELAGESANARDAQIASSVPQPEHCSGSEGSLKASVDPNIAYQTIDGFGTSVRLFDDPHLTKTFDQNTRRSAAIIPKADQNKILNLLYREMGLTMARPVIEGMIEPLNDNSDPNATDLSKFHFSWKGGDGYITYVKRAARVGLRDYFLAPLLPETWMTEGNPAEYVEYAMALLLHWKSQGLEMPYYSIYNEPGYFQGRTTRSGEFLRDVIRLLGPRISAAGLKTKIVVPDEIRSSIAAQKSMVILSDPVARQYVGALATHLYDEPLVNMRAMKQLSQQYNIPLWMTEFSIHALDTAGIRQRDYLAWAGLMHQLLVDYNVSAIFYLWGFFGQWSENSSLIQIENRGSTYLGFAPQKALFAMGQFARYARPGSTRISVSYAIDPAILISAFKSRTAVSVIAINNGPSRQIVLSLLGKQAGPVRGTRTSDTEDFVPVTIYCRRGSEVVLVLPSRSITSVMIDYK